MIPKYGGELTTVAVLPEYLSAPVKAGQKIGTVGFYSGKTLAAETDIIAAEDVARLSMLYTLRRLFVSRYF